MDASRLQRCWHLLRYFGPKWLMYRAYYAARMKSGLIRLQRPATTWSQQPLSTFLTDQSLGDIERYAEYRKSSSPQFFFDPHAISEFQSFFGRWDKIESSPTIVADDLRRGFTQFFSHDRVEVGFPPRWHTDPFSGHQFPSDRHWTQIGDFGAGDIKLVWETNRFSFAFSLVRSYWRTGDEGYAELFWQLVESWHATNPPETGSNWKCGQEISLRVMAWCFGLYGFGTSPASTPARVAMLAQMIAVSGRRIEFNIRYALSQQNNHGLGEAMGLWTIGALFPEFTDSSRWATRGRQLLESQAFELIYADGAFSQHSMNYHRVMLHDYLWSMRLGDVLDQPFSNRLRDRIARAGEFVHQLQDETTGRVPCYGQNDGALILPLSNCDYRDYRPVVEATHFLATGNRRSKAGPWDEDLLWLFGTAAMKDSPAIRPAGTTAQLCSKKGGGGAPSSEALVDFNATLGGFLEARCAPATLDAPCTIAHSDLNDGARLRSKENANPLTLTLSPQGRGEGTTGTIAHGDLEANSRSDFDAPDGGYSTLRSPSGFAFIRAGSFRHRPVQADMLHVDIWWRGENIAIDPGTFSYNAPPPWDNRLAHTSHHNTVTVDGRDQMERAGRFLWLPWLSGKSFDRNQRGNADVGCWNGEHNGYQRLADPVTHRRGLVRLGADHWLVVDSLHGNKPHSFRLHWLLLDAPYELDSHKRSIELQTSVGRYRLASTASNSESRFDMVRASSNSAIGWRSDFYHARTPAISVSVDAHGSSIVFATVLGPDAQPPIIENDIVRVQATAWSAIAVMDLSKARGVPLVASLQTAGFLTNPISKVA